MLSFVFEFIGTTELLVILIVALILFGPRKLPELGRSLGRSLSEFKRASEDFKRTWEMEVEVERAGREERIHQAILPEDRPAAVAVATDPTREDEDFTLDETVARQSPTSTASSPTTPDDPSPAPSRKQDWL